MVPVPSPLYRHTSYCFVKRQAPGAADERRTPKSTTAALTVRPYGLIIPSTKEMPARTAVAADAHPARAFHADDEKVDDEFEGYQHPDLASSKRDASPPTSPSYRSCSGADRSPAGVTPPSCPGGIARQNQGDTMTRLILLALLLTTPAHADWPSGISSCAIARSVAQFVG